MEKIKVVINGLGNIGKHAIDALETAQDMKCIGVLRRKDSVGKRVQDLRGIKDYASMEDLIAEQGKPHVVIVCSPSRAAIDEDEKFLKMGINTVDSFDIHNDIVNAVERLNPVAQEAGVSAIVSVGWDPGTDSALRAYFEAMAPIGTTFTNFGRGKSMGHSVAAKSIKGVADAVALTVPLGGGSHSRIVYVVLEHGENIEKVTARIKEDSYFSKDPLKVIPLESKAELEMVADNSHGVRLERVGGAGTVSNQHFVFDMRINNPALTSQALISYARAAVRMPKGAYTAIDVPPVLLLPGDRMNNIRRLV